jgi:ribonuclease R
MKKARYDTIPIGHFGLAMQHYTHFTSPIRRICDLVVHHLIRQHIWQQGSSHSLKPRNLQNIADNASERELLSDSAERETASQFKKLYMKDKIGEVYQALIVNMNNNNIIVELDDIPVSGIVPLASLTDDNYNFYSRYMELIGKRGKRVFRILDRITVKLDRIEFDLTFSLVENSKK